MSTNPILRLSVTPTLLCLTVAAMAQGTHSETTLKMVATVKSQSYCVVDAGNPAQRVDRIGTVLLNLRIRIENVSDHNVILCKACIEDNGLRFRKIGSDGGPGEYLPAFIIDRYGYEKVSTSNRPDNNYVILAPEHSYETEISTGRMVNLESETPYNANKGILFNGKYFFQANVITWWQPSSITSKLKLRWKQFGELSDDELESQLIPIDVNFPGDAPNCVK